MGLLKLNFIDVPPADYKHPLEKLLHTYGEDIANYAKGFFSYLVTLSSYNDQVQSASLYILVPELGVDYQVLTLNIKDVETIDLCFFTLKTKQVEVEPIKVKIMQGDYSAVEPVVKKHLESRLANQTFRFLTDQVLMKRESRAEKFDEME